MILCPRDPRPPARAWPAAQNASPPWQVWHPRPATRACDSGLHRGKRRIRGGRADLRRALCLAGFIASRYDPAIRAFRTKLEDAGKPTKLAITACARKLLTILNAMLRDQKDYCKQPT